jgi:hypothetical protein
LRAYIEDRMPEEDLSPSGSLSAGILNPWLGSESLPGLFRIGDSYGKPEGEENVEWCLNEEGWYEKDAMIPPTDTT